MTARGSVHGHMTLSARSHDFIYLRHFRRLIKWCDEVNKQYASACPQNTAECFFM